MSKNFNNNLNNDFNDLFSDITQNTPSPTSLDKTDFNHEVSEKIKESKQLVKPKTKRLSAEKRQESILKATIELFETPIDKFSIAILAKHMQVSEKTIAKYFSNKSLILFALVNWLESHVFSQINQIEETSEDGLQTIQKIVVMVFKFIEQNKGIARILTNEALFFESPLLQQKIAKLMDRLEASFKQSYRIAIAQGYTGLQKGQEASKAYWLNSYMMGAFQRFSRSQFEKLPSCYWEQHQWMLG